MKKLLSVFIIAIYLLGVSFVRASDFSSTRNLGLSGALRGAISLNEGLYSNPASFGFTQKYSIEGGASIQDSNRFYNFSIVDTKTSTFGAGLSYTKKDDLSNQGEDENQIHGALAKRLGVFSLGLGGKYFFNNNKNEVDASLGVLVALHPQIHVGVVGDYLLTPEKREVGFGAQFNIYDILLLSVDGFKKLEEEGVGVQAGMEVLHETTGFSLRSGTHYNTADAFQSYSFGLGWALHKIGLTYGFQKDLKKVESIHALSMRIFF